MSEADLRIRILKPQNTQKVDFQVIVSVDLNVALVGWEREQSDINSSRFSSLKTPNNFDFQVVLVAWEGNIRESMFPRAATFLNFQVALRKQLKMRKAFKSQSSPKLLMWLEGDHLGIQVSRFSSLKAS